MCKYGSEAGVFRTAHAADESARIDATSRIPNRACRIRNACLKGSRLTQRYHWCRCFIFIISALEQKAAT